MATRVFCIAGGVLTNLAIGFQGQQRRLGEQLEVRERRQALLMNYGGAFDWIPIEMPEPLRRLPSTATKATSEDLNSESRAL